MSSGTNTGDNEGEVLARVKILYSGVRGIRESILKQTSEVWVLQPGLHVGDNSLVSLSPGSPHQPGTFYERTSTTELLKVRHSGLGRMKGNSKEPSE